MKIREITEQNEKLIFSPYAQLSSESAGRPIPMEEDDIRTCYQRDRDRIIHSKAFRRLKHKTQVFTNFNNNDHLRTRLTHTLEVSQIARTIARSLRLNEDLVEAISNSHDVGHTAFSHTGENILNEIFGSFNHNEYSAKICTELNLSKEVIDGVLNHSSSKCGDSEASTLEGQIVRYADKFAYLNADFQDAFTMGLITEQDIPKELTNILGNSPQERLCKMITDIIDTSMNQNYIKMSVEVNFAYKNLREFMFENVYLTKEVRQNDENIKKILYSIYENERKKGLSQEDILHFMVGMTDTFCYQYYYLNI